MKYSVSYVLDGKRKRSVCRLDSQKDLMAQAVRVLGDYYGYGRDVRVLSLQRVRSQSSVGGYGNPRHYKN